MHANLVGKMIESKFCHGEGNVSWTYSVLFKFMYLFMYSCIMFRFIHTLVRSLVNACAHWFIYSYMESFKSFAYSFIQFSFPFFFCFSFVNIFLESLVAKMRKIWVISDSFDKTWISRRIKLRERRYLGRIEFSYLLTVYFCSYHFNRKQW